MNSSNHNVATKSKLSTRQINTQDDKFDYRKNIAAIERVRTPLLDSKNHPEKNNDTDSNRGGESDYIYSPSSDRGKKQEQNIKKS